MLISHFAKGMQSYHSYMYTIYGFNVEFNNILFDINLRKTKGKIRKDIMFKWSPNKGQYFFVQKTIFYDLKYRKQTKILCFVVPNDMRDGISNTPASLLGQSQPDF